MCRDLASRAARIVHTTRRVPFHAQSTYVNQYAFPFRSPYHGVNSLAPNHGRETWDLSFYAGMRLWSGAELWINPEVDQGFGLSNTHGVAGYVSGEAYKIGSSFPYARVPRYFVEMVVFHEMLHQIHPPAVDGAGRRVVHGTEFRAAERRFPGYLRARAWEKAHLHLLLRQRS